MPYSYIFSYIFVIIGAIISGIAALNVKSTFKKYSKVINSKDLTGRDAAEFILHSSGIYDVAIERISGSLTDHYSPKEKVLRLSEDVYSSRSVAAIGVAAHECGHAIQDQVSYTPLMLRSVSVPVANIGSRLSWPILLLGLILGFPQIAEIGIWLFVLVVAFQLITLPVEFNASHRALKILEGNALLSTNELAGSRKVLTAAAMTYVAALFTAVLQLLRMIMIANGGNRKNTK